jgi:glycosyltransferase involved in cell wall biosynthesis
MPQEATRHGAATTGRASQRRLRIVHCFRAPVGGLFRHVRDLAEEQHGAGHQVGIICDSTTGGAFEDAAFRQVLPHLALGLHRFPMRRQIAPSDIVATFALLREVRSLHPDVLHAHGAKGGAYARVIGTLLRASGSRVARIYTPHGGSLNYDRNSLGGWIYFAAERALGAMTDAFVFVSQYEADAYATKVGRPRKPFAVVRNGLRAEEFEPVAPGPDARDFLFIGTLRDLKGPDIFIRALGQIRDRTGRTPSAWIVGDGEDKPRYEALVNELGLSRAVGFRPSLPAREAFALARTTVIPSRAESMPYIILEVAAAAVPLIATNVGGIPEVFGSDSGRLVPPGDPDRLAAAMTEALNAPAAAANAAVALRSAIRGQFSVAAMAAGIEAVYRRASDLQS